MLRRMTSVSARFGAPPAVLSRPETRLFLTATTILFVELLLIRWIPAQVIYVGYFRNFLLMASLPRDRRRHPLGPRPEPDPDLPVRAGPAGAGRARDPVPASGSSSRRPTRSSSACRESTGADINFLVLPAMVMLATVIMAGLAIPLGGLLKSMPPLKAYAIDILGSMTGVAAVHGPVGRRDAARSSGSASSRSCVSLMGLGVRACVDPPPSRQPRSAPSWRWSSSARRRNQSWSPYYRIEEYESGGHRSHQRQRHPAPGRCGRSTS